MIDAGGPAFEAPRETPPRSQEVISLQRKETQERLYNQSALSMRSAQASSYVVALGRRARSRLLPDRQSAPAIPLSRPSVREEARRGARLRSGRGGASGSREVRGPRQTDGGESPRAIRSGRLPRLAADRGVYGWRPGRVPARPAVSLVVKKNTSLAEVMRRSLPRIFGIKNTRIREGGERWPYRDHRCGWSRRRRRSIRPRV